ncbi:hypothetical protein [Nitrosomonas aestuarii]|uniref:hypothetical protein n=1 Tax=Nitrosomonas aestuarii TaxID=52441 RepID=UPI00111368B5|nr:hypothetical protein [Nitrosomonas aestuarii]
MTQKTPRPQSYSGKLEPLSGSIATDRPTFSLGTATIPNGRMQFETGYTFTFDHNNPDKATHTFPETLVRIGLN